MRPEFVNALWIASLILYAGIFPALAQSEASTDPAVQNGTKVAPEHALGDWSGLRTNLLDDGVDLTLQYLSETVSVVSGGVRRGTDYAHSIDLKTDIDMGKLIGLSDFSLHGALVERAGRNASSDFLDEHLTQVQEIYGSGGDVAAHLAYLYAEQKLLNGLFDIEGGRLDVGQDFADSPLYCEFMTLSVCPSPRSLALDPGFTVYPSSTWGGRLKITPTKTFAIQAGIYQVRPLFGGPSGFDWSTDDTKGAYIPVELDWTPDFSNDHLIGHYKLGMGYDTSTYPDLYASAGGGAIGIGAAPSRPDHGSRNYYILGDQMLARTGPNGTDGIILLAGYSWADPDTTPMANLVFGGILANGIIPGRKLDSIGFQVTHFTVSGRLQATQLLESLDGLMLTSGLTDAPPPDGVQGEETVYEARYDFGVVEGVHVMPDIQYVTHPNAVSKVPNAAIPGVRLRLDV